MAPVVATLSASSSASRGCRRAVELGLRKESAVRGTVINRDELLAYRQCSTGCSLQMDSPTGGLTTKLCKEVAAWKAAALPPPPGLQAQQKKTSPPTGTCRTAQTHQVLLRDFPEAWMSRVYIRQMLGQAGVLGDLLDVSTRTGGKALLAFSTAASVAPCIRYFNGYQASDAEAPIKATYVVVVTKDAPSDVNAKTNKELRADAPAFKPASVLSADASVFVPNSEKNDKDDRGRFNSDASTIAGEPNSEDMSEESDASDTEE